MEGQEGHGTPGRAMKNVEVIEGVGTPSRAMEGHVPLFRAMEAIEHHLGPWNTIEAFEGHEEPWRAVGGCGTPLRAF